MNPARTQFEASCLTNAIRELFKRQDHYLFGTADALLLRGEICSGRSDNYYRCVFVIDEVTIEVGKCRQFEG